MPAASISTFPVVQIHSCWSRATQCFTSCSACGTRRTGLLSALIAPKDRSDQRQSLDEIAGIGPTRRRALLNHFGSAKAVSRAGVEDLKAVEGISAEMAAKIYDFFHERRG